MIDDLTSICFIKKEKEKIEEEEFKKIREKYQSDYDDYFEKNWLKLILNKQIDYSNEMRSSTDIILTLKTTIDR